MKLVTLFYQKNCPFCKKAFAYIEEQKELHPEFSEIEIDAIEETEHPDIAEQYDYYHVPTFYIDDQKIHEGGIFSNEIENILRLALN